MCAAAGWWLPALEERACGSVEFDRSMRFRWDRRVVRLCLCYIDIAVCEWHAPGRSLAHASRSGCTAETTGWCDGQSCNSHRPGYPTPQLRGEGLRLRPACYYMQGHEMEAAIANGCNGAGEGRSHVMCGMHSCLCQQQDAAKGMTTLTT